MMDFNISNRETLTLIRNTVSGELRWTNLGLLKSYLKQENISLNSLHYFKEYLNYLQNRSFIFNCFDTYIAIYNKKLFIFAQNKYSPSCRLDVTRLDDTVKWKQINPSTDVLYRLRNSIILTTNDVDEVHNFSDLLSSISLSIPV